MAKLSESVTVQNISAFDIALKDEYGKIFVTGEAAIKLKKYVAKQKVSNFLGVLTLPLLIIAWPFAIATLLGGLITSNNIRYYKVLSLNDDGSITLLHKKAKKHIVQ